MKAPIERFLCDSGDDTKIVSLFHGCIFKDAALALCC